MRPAVPFPTLAFAVVAVALTTARAAPAESVRLDHKIAPTFEAVRMAVDAGSEGYRGSVQIELTANERAGSFQFHARGLTLGRIQLRSTSRDYAVTADPERDGIVTVKVAPALEPGDYTLALDFSRAFDTHGMGFYKRTAGGKSYTFSQFETSDARRAFPCWDEPEFKIPWQVTLIVPKDHLAISNTPIEKRTEFGAQSIVQFQRTPPMPSYLVALATGPFDTLAVPGLPVPGRVVTCAGQSELGAEAARVAPALLKQLENYFGQAYPYAKLDLIAAPDFAYGAMENPGAVTFDDKSLLVDPGDPNSEPRRELAEIMAHELAHMWFGDLVTLRKWEDLWLNESFASWIGDRVANAAFPDYGIGGTSVGQSDAAMQADARATARAMRRPVASAERLDQLADGLTYARGRSVLSMFEQWLGSRVFQAGVASYLEQHAWKTADARDLWQALGQASGQDVGAAMSTFVNQPGVPLVRCELFQNGRVVLSQKRLSSDVDAGSGTGRWSIPVALKFSDGGTVRVMTVLLTEPSQSVLLPTGGATAWVMPDADARGYYRWQVPAPMLQAIARQSRALLTRRERVRFVLNLTALIGTGDVHGDDYLRALAEFSGDPDPEVIGAVVQALEPARQAFAAPDNPEPFARYVRATLGPALDRIGLDPGLGEPNAVTLLRPTLLRWVGDVGGDARVLEHCEALASTYLLSPASVPPSLVEEALALAAIRGDATLFSEYRRRFEAAPTRLERRRYLEAMGSFRSHPLMLRALAYVLKGPLKTQELLTIPRAIAASGALDEELYVWLTANYDAIANRMPAEMTTVMPQLVSGCSLKLLDSAQGFFDDPHHRAAGTESEVAQMVEQMRRCITLHERDARAVDAYLEGPVGSK